LISIRTAVLYVAAMIILKSLAGLITLKVQASILTPSNFAVLSQFMTITGLVTNISSAMITSGMTVLLARSTSQANTGQLVKTGKVFSLGVSCAISVACLTLYWYGAGILSINPLPQYLFLMLAVSPWMITQSSIAQARLTNSFRLSRFTKLSNISAIAVAILITTLTLYFGLIGGAIAVAVGPMLAACILLLFAANKGLENESSHPTGDHLKNITELIRFSVAMLVAICAVPISHIVVRESMVATGSSAQAGLWSSAVRLSDVYMQFFGLLLTVYILPKISSHSALNESKRLFTNYLSRLSLIGALGLGVLFILR
jgi:O-antigen/teichoic acid export membrane protein